MTRAGLSLSLVGLVLGLGFLLAPERSGRAGEEAASGPRSELRKAIAAGKAHFSDAGLGPRGKTCAGWYQDPGRAKLHLSGRANSYPKWDRREGRVITLGQKANQMIERMLGGKVEELGSERLVAIEAYLMSISRDAE